MPGQQAVALDILYPSGFYSFQTPVMLDYVAAINGVAAPVAPGEPFTYLDLGCGDGFTIVLLAAAYPQGRFVGVDVNPAHVAAGRALAASGGVENVRLVEGAFEDWRRLDIADCDYLAMHGVYAWIGEAARSAVLELAAARLKPGGLLYVSYNAYPGWAAVAPLRQFLLEYTRGMAGDPLANVAATLRHLKDLRAKGAGYFAQNPAAARMLDEMAGKDIRYVAHEIYSPHWSPLPFAAVNRQMAGAGLSFAGSAELAKNYARPSVRAEFLPLILRETDRGRLELHRDYVNNTFFRRDVYAKAPAAARGDPASLLAGMPFGSRVPLAAMSRAIPLPDGEMPLVDESYEALRRALAGGTRRIAELAALPPFRGATAAVAQALQIMAIGNQIAPFATAAVAQGAPGDWTVTHPLNRRLLAQPLGSESYAVAISPVLGTVAPVPREEALAILAVAEAGREGAAEWAWRHAEQRSGRRAAGAPLTERKAHDAAFARIRAGLGERLAKLVEFGVVAPR